MMVITVSKRYFEGRFNRTLLFLVVILFLVSGCRTVRGSGNIIREARAVSNFERVALSGSAELILTQGEKESLEIEAEDNIIPVLESEVRGDTLYIGVKDGVNVRTDEAITYYLTVVEINSLELSGVTSATAESLVADNFTLEMSGNGSVHIDSLTADSFEIDISGKGDLSVAGQVTEQRIVISGSGSYEAADLQSETAELEVSGAGDLTVWVEQALSVDISGNGSVSYYGSPTVSQDVSGSGDLTGLGGR